MKAYQCSKCENLQDYDDYCNCSLGIDIRPNYRERGSAKTCKENFKPLKEGKEWQIKRKCIMKDFKTCKYGVEGYHAFYCDYKRAGILPCPKDSGTDGKGNMECYQYTVEEKDKTQYKWNPKQGR